MKNTISVSNPFKWIEDLFKHYKRPATYDEPYDFLCLVSGRVDSPGPRDQRWEFIRDTGMGLIEKVLARKPIGKGPHFFIFPDRWMVPGEAVEFASALSENPDAKKFERVYVVTHAPYIVSDCLREQVLILRKENS